MGKIYAAYTMKKAPLAVTNGTARGALLFTAPPVFPSTPHPSLSPFSLLQDPLHLGCGGVPHIRADLASDLSL